MNRTRLEELRKHNNGTGLLRQERFELLEAVNALLARVENMDTLASELNAAALRDCTRITDLRKALSDIEDYAAAGGPDAAWYETKALGALEIDSRDPEQENETPICHICKTRWRKDDPALLKLVDWCVRCSQFFCDECQADGGVCQQCERKG